MSRYEPPSATTSQQLVNDEDILPPEIRRWNRIRTIHATVALAGNTLSLEQVAAICDAMEQEKINKTNSNTPLL
ncbi:MAG: hypothetical protein NVS3B3_18750 [Aquirhabdus sp.]